MFSYDVRGIAMSCPPNKKSCHLYGYDSENFNECMRPGLKWNCNVRKKKENKTLNVGIIAPEEYFGLHVMLKGI